jgi:hypothetical protein
LKGGVWFCARLGGWHPRRVASVGGGSSGGQCPWKKGWYLGCVMVGCSLG